MALLVTIPPRKVHAAVSCKGLLHAFAVSNAWGAPCASRKPAVFTVFEAASPMRYNAKTKARV